MVGLRDQGQAGIALALFALWVAILPAAAQNASFAALAVTAKPIEHFEIGRDTTHFGELEFRGGIELVSRNDNFGGWSGIDFDPMSGRLIAVSDTGWWLIAKPVEKAGRLTGIAEARIGRMLDPKGRPIRRKSEADAEAVRLLKSGGPGMLVMYEEGASLRQFNGPLDRLPAIVPKELPLPDAVRRRSGSQGIEAIAIAPAQSTFKDAILLIAEHELDEKGNHRAWILSGASQETFFVKRSGNFDITDAEFLSDGDLVILERRFGLTEGVGVRIRRIKSADIKPGVTVDGGVVMEADLRYQIDNMEGMALRQGPSGEIVVTLISDDNKSVLQRTLLLQFAWRPFGNNGEATAAEP